MTSIKNAWNLESNCLVTVVGSSQHNWGMFGIESMGRELASLSASLMLAELYSAQLKVRNKLGGYHGINLCSLQLPKLLGPTHTTQHGGEVPLKLVVITLFPGDQLFDTLVLVSGVIQQVGDTLPHVELLL